MGTGSVMVPVGGVYIPARLAMRDGPRAESDRTVTKGKDMSEIAWTDKTWNPVVGCTKVSAGCVNCYAERMACRLACMGQRKYQLVLDGTGIVLPGDPNSDRYTHWNTEVFCDESALKIPLHWRKPRMIFVCSMGDLFHESVPFEFIAEVWKVMAFCPQHTFQILTKRPERKVEFLKWLENKHTYDGGALLFKKEGGGWIHKQWPLPNVWLGTSVSTTRDYENIFHLKACRAAKLFLSLEPLLEGLSLSVDTLDKIDWLIIGAESKGNWPGRECKIEDVRSLVQQGQAAGVAVFVKQIHGIDPFINHRLTSKGKPILLKYPKDIAQFPADLRVQDYPKGAK